MTPPLAVLSQFLTERRAAGEAFADVWADAVQLALADVRDSDERKRWRQALNGTAAAWRASYERRPAGRRERHLSLLADPVDREPFDGCPRCEATGCEELVTAHPQGLEKRYCSKRCRTRASDAARAKVKNQRRREQRQLAQQQAAA